MLIKEILNADLESEIRAVGFDANYASFAVDKFRYKTLKIFGVNVAQANILKQTALSVGADCATHHDVITGKIEVSNCILGGSFSQLKLIAKKLEAQPFGLKELGRQILAQLDFKQTAPKIVGILNLTQNSFSDGGLYWDFEDAKAKFLSLIEDGADIIDIGAESTKPFSQGVSAEDQLEKIMPILDFARSLANCPTISIDTRSALVAEEVLKNGAKIINDVSGLDYDSKMADVVTKFGVPIVIQHSKGTPENMQTAPHYEHVIDEIFLALNEKINIARQKGIENIIIDPGIGFGKRAEDNLEIIRRVGEFKSLGCPIMLGVSRKSFMNSDDNDIKDSLTLAFNALAPVDYLRVHNVRLHKKFISLQQHLLS